MGTVLLHAPELVESRHLSPDVRVMPEVAMAQVAVLVVDAQSARLAWPMTPWEVAKAVTVPVWV